MTVNSHEGEDYPVQLLDEPLLFLAVVARVPVKDVHPSKPEVFLWGLRGGADDDAVLHHWLRGIVLAG